MGKAGGTKEQAAYTPVIQNQLQEIGMDVEVFLADTAVVQERFVATAEYDLRDNGGGVYGAEPANGAAYFHTKNHMPAGLNYSRYSNPEVDALIDSALETTDQAERKTIYTEVVRILNDEAPTVFLWVPNSVCAFNKRLEGFKPTSYLDNYLWNAEEWSIAQ
jgi:peptide/nickel transport system substrate-binding protein